MPYISKDELKKFAENKMAENDRIDDEWYSFDENNDVIDINMYDDGSGMISVTAYPVIKSNHSNYNTTDTSTVLGHITIPKK